MMDVMTYPCWVEGFLHDWPWISPWINRYPTSQISLFSWSRHNGVWSSWRRQQLVVASSVERKRASETLRRYGKIVAFIVISLQWRHYDHDGVSNHQHHGCLLNRLFGCRSKKTSKLRVTGLCAGNSLGTGEFPPQMAGYAENVSIWLRHHVLIRYVV